MIIIVAIHRACRTFRNLPACNISVLFAACSICTIVGSIFGFHEDWALKQPVYVFRAFCILAICVAICYAYLIQAISRLFFTVFSKHKYLATYRVHWCLIALNWIISILISIVPFFIHGAYVYENESRFCVPTSKKFSSSMYAMVVGFVIPLNISIIIYGIIFYHVKRSSRRITPAISNNMTAHIPNASREMKLARNMIILEMFFTASETPFLMLSLWQGIQPKSPPPESFYLLSINSISLFIALTMIALFCMNKQVKDIALNYQHCEQRSTHPVANRQQ